MNSAALLADAGHSLSGKRSLLRSLFGFRVSVGGEPWAVNAISFFPTGTPPFACVTYGLVFRPPGRFRCPHFVAPLAPAAQSTIPVRSRQVRNGRHGRGRRPAHWWRAGHMRAFALAPPLSVVGNRRVGGTGPAADGVD